MIKLAVYLSPTVLCLVLALRLASMHPPSTSAATELVRTLPGTPFAQVQQLLAQLSNPSNVLLLVRSAK